VLRQQQPQTFACCRPCWALLCLLLLAQVLLLLQVLLLVLPSGHSWSVSHVQALMPVCQQHQQQQQQGLHLRAQLSC
jgi:hypothetical protein